MNTKSEAEGSLSPIAIGIAVIVVVAGLVWVFSKPSDDDKKTPTRAVAMNKQQHVDRMKNTTPIKLPPKLQQRINGPRLKKADVVPTPSARDRASEPVAAADPKPTATAGTASGEPAEGRAAEARETPTAKAPTGTLSKEAIQASIKAVTPKIKACFEQGLKHDPSLAGKVVIEFDIEANDEGKGVVNRGEVKSAVTQSPFFEACVLKEVAGASFDAPEGGGKVVVRYPFKFDPGGGFGGEAPPDDATAKTDAP